MVIGSFLCLPKETAISPISIASEFAKQGNFSSSSSARNFLEENSPVVMLLFKKSNTTWIEVTLYLQLYDLSLFVVSSQVQILSL